MRVRPIDLSNLDTVDQLKTKLSDVIRNILEAVNGRLNFGENIEASEVTAVFPGANTTIQVSHSLGRVPTGYIVSSKSAAIHVHDGNKENTDKHLYVQASAAGTVKLWVI
jgi:hypothetical protein